MQRITPFLWFENQAEQAAKQDELSARDLVADAAGIAGGTVLAAQTR